MTDNRQAENRQTGGVPICCSMNSLYVIGVGSGDPELLTLKAVRIIREVPVLFVPKGREDGKSLALSIVSSVIDLNGKDIRELHFPMVKTGHINPEHEERWEMITAEMGKALVSSDCAFLTLGDPSLYSTFFYLYDRLLGLKPDLKIEIIPGVSSINAAAAKARMSLALADEKIAILPATYMEGIKETLDRFDTIVLMKVNSVFSGVVDMLGEMNLTDNAVYICRAGMDDERVFRDIRDVRETDLDYFSLVIIKKGPQKIRDFSGRQ